MVRKAKKEGMKANACINTHTLFLRRINVQAPYSENEGNGVSFSITTHNTQQRNREREVFLFLIE